MKKKTVYAVTYRDDNGKKHLTFVEGYSSVRFIQDRFYNVTFESTVTYCHNICNIDF